MPLSARPGGLFIAWRAPALLALAALAACGEFQDPQSSGGDRVMTVEGLVCEGPRPVVFSPDGEWLLVSAIREFRDGVLPHPELGLFRPGRGEPAWPEAADDQAAAMLAAGRHPRTENACWSDAQTVHFPVGSAVSVNHSAGATSPDRRSGFFVRLSRPDRLRFGAIPDDCRRPSWSQWRYASPDSAVAVAGNRIDAVQLEGSDPTVRLLAGGGRVIATHAARDALANQIVLAAYAWSPSGSKLAYLLSENVGSIGRPNRLWLSRGTGLDPEPLATGVYSIQWRDERTLFGCGRIGGERALSVIRWTLAE